MVHFLHTVPVEIFLMTLVIIDVVIVLAMVVIDIYIIQGNYVITVQLKTSLILMSSNSMLEADNLWYAYGGLIVI